MQIDDSNIGTLYFMTTTAATFRPLIIYGRSKSMVCVAYSEPTKFSYLLWKIQNYLKKLWRPNLKSKFCATQTNRPLLEQS